jgi:hypothetical protein
VITNGQREHYLVAEGIPRCISIKFDQQANNCCQFADSFYNSMIDNKDSHRLSPQIMFTFTALPHALLEWEMNKGIHLNSSKAKLQANRPEGLNYFNNKNDGGMIASCCAANGHMLWTSPGVVDTYTVLMNTWNTLQESYQQRECENTLGEVQCQIQQAENPTSTAVFSTEEGCVDNGIIRDNLTSEVAHEEPQIGITLPNITIGINWTDKTLHFAMLGGYKDDEDECDKFREINAMPTASRRRLPATQPEMFGLGTS